MRLCWDLIVMNSRVSDGYYVILNKPQRRKSKMVSAVYKQRLYHVSMQSR
jgi:hypothetical protein